MGIRGLETYMKGFVPNGSKDVNMIKEIEKYKK